MIFLKRAFVGATLWLAGATAALAAGTQTATISSATFTDLGAAPLQVQTFTNPVTLVVADSLPSVGTNGVNLLPGPPVIFQPADSSSHVYAALLGAKSVVAYTPVYSTGGSAGGTVSVSNFPVTQPVSAALAAMVDGAIVSLGAEADGACATDNGTCDALQLLKRIAQRLTSMIGALPSNYSLETGGNLATIAGAISSSKMAVKAADGDIATEGITTGSAVITDAAGTLQQYLRGLIKQWIAGTLVIGPGSNAIGNNGANTTEVCVAPTVTASSAYTAGNEVGGLMTFAAAVNATGSGKVVSTRIDMKSVQTAEFDLFLFVANPSNSTWTDKSAPAINVADEVNVLAPIRHTTNSSGLGTHTVYGQDGIWKDFKLASGTSLYGILVTPGTPTFASTSDVQVCVTVEKDS
jgi:hypothetical protein